MFRTSRRIIRWWIPVCLLLAVARPSAGVPFPETEPNSVKPEADPAFNMLPGDFLTGTTMGNITGPGNGALNTADYFLVQTAPQPPGIYRHQLMINTPGPQQHTGFIRGLTQTGGVINPGTDPSAQSSATLPPPRINRWYGFGQGEQIFYSITGTGATNQPYTCTLNSQLVPPNIIGPFREGPIHITTIAQGHATDTDLWVYDANFNPIPGFGNDDSFGLTQSSLTRNYAAGRYYLAISDFNVANDQASPPDDDYQNGNVMDFPGCAANSDTAVGQNVGFAVTDGAGTQNFPATKAGPFDLVWFCFDVQTFVPPAQDCWRTECGTTAYSFDNTPIPCSFFDPGSEPFDGLVQLGGGDPGDNDTIVERLNSMSFGTSFPENQVVPIELVSLNLVSCSPITVRYCTGQPDELWDVSVGLSAVSPPPGQMTVTKTHPNGGTFTSDFFVQPVFTFTRQSDSAVRVLDTGLEAIPPMFLDSTDPAPWVHNATIPVGPVICGINFVPGVQEANVPATPGSTCVSTVQCCKAVGHGGYIGAPGEHFHVVGHICTDCPCGACCNPADGSCIEVSAADPDVVCAAMFGGTGQFKGISSSCTSADGDSIPDSYETGYCCPSANCGTGSLCSSPTDPSRTDTDGDGLSDDADAFPCNRCLPLSAPGRPAICDQFDSTLPGDGDCDDDGTCDLCQIEAGTSHDCNRNGVPDECEPDCNNNGLPDDYDIGCGTSLDVNGNDIPDECECLTCPGDVNGDGMIDGRDIRCFILCMLFGGGPGCNCGCADMDGSGLVDVLDINPFVVAVLAKPSECPAGELEVAAPVIGAGPGRLNFNVSVELGGPFNNALASGEGSLQLNQGIPSFFDVIWHSDGNPGQMVPPFTVQIPGQTPIQDNGPAGTSWTLNGSIDINGDPDPGTEPDADVQVSLIGPPLAQLGDAGARYDLDPLPGPSFATVRDPNAFGGLPPGTVIPINRHPVKIKKFCVYRIVFIFASIPPGPPVCPAGWSEGDNLCVECDSRQKPPTGSCPPTGLYTVAGFNCLLFLELQPGGCGTCYTSPPPPAGTGVAHVAKFVGWELFPKP